MYGVLFLKECKRTVKSIPYLILVVMLLVFGYTQIVPEFSMIEKPEPNQASYGVKYEEIPGVIMPSAAKSLYSEFAANTYVAYPLGFYKNVKLSDNKQARMADILSELTGTPKEDFMKSAGVKPETGSTLRIGDGSLMNLTPNGDGSYKLTIPKGQSSGSESAGSAITDVTVAKGLTYERFRELMKQADKLIGGGSMYDGIYLTRQFGRVPMTYDDALLQYNDIIEKDRISGAYARVFCDYFGLVLGIFPVFIAVALGMRDRRAGMLDLIYTRKASSIQIVFTRYLAMIVMMLLPVLLMAVYAAISVAGKYSGMETDGLAFVKYSLGWLLPTLMASTAVGVFLTELTDFPIAIAVQGLWWFLGMFAGMKHLDGGYGWDLFLRHNKIGNTQVFLDNFNTLLTNRILYAGLSIVLILLTVWIYELKRRGKLHAYNRIPKIFNHRRRKSAA
ncbi:ABC transporter permease [Paenibacillus caui]|uniref:ABC transporter permease n=1 Tax=Paenibacillus caui TaxID=2873927 RepID=UPI001CA9C796|nr:ABC transporter permease [Paenibacillus caui]